MLKNIINLTKIFLFSFYSRGGKKRFTTGKILLYGFLILYLAGMFGYLSYEMLKQLIAVRQEGVFLGILCMGIISLSLLTALVTVLNLFYFSADNLHLLPLPLKPIEILSAKLNTMMAYVYAEELMFVCGPMIVYGVMTKQSFLFYILAFLTLLALPVIPVLLASLLVMIVMAALGGIRNKNLVQMLTMTITILFSLGISLTINGNGVQEDPQVLLFKANGLLKVYNSLFPTMPLATSAMIDHDLLSFFLLLLVSALCYVLICLFGQKIYYKGMIGSLFSSSGISGKKLDEKKAYESRGLLFSYVMKEFRIYFRKPFYFVQLVLPCLILPFFMIATFYFSFRASGGDITDETLQLIYEDSSFSPYIVAGVVLIAMFISLYCFISTIAVSKDGKDACIMKYIPVPFYKQIIYKMLPDVLMCLLSFLVVFASLALLFKVPFLYILEAVPVAVFYCILHGFLILSDVRKPKLYWTSETQVVKNNLRMGISMVCSVLNMGIVALLAFVVQMPGIWLCILLTLLYFGLDALIYSYIRKKDIALANGFE